MLDQRCTNVIQMFCVCWAVKSEYVILPLTRGDCVNIALRRFNYTLWQYRDKTKPEGEIMSYSYRMS